jgi:hypothetical protein
MLRQAKDLESYKLRARDGDIGRVNEFYFDDRYWTVRYLVADTAGWLSGRRVLISPYALRPANVIDRVLPVNLSKKQIEESPSLATQEPVSRQYEMQYYGYYGWPDYAYGSYMWGGAPYIQRDLEASRELRRHEDAWDPNLRSTNDVTGHFIQAQDGEVGHVADFLIDDDCWAIRYLIVDTKNWWSGKHVLVSPQWIEHVSWRESKVFVNLTRETIKQAPEYKPASFSRQYEAELHAAYTQRGYWDDARTGGKSNATGRPDLP